MASGEAKASDRVPHIVIVGAGYVMLLLLLFIAWSLEVLTFLMFAFWSATSLLVGKFPICVAWLVSLLLYNSSANWALEILL